jgi:hypothetical protein
MMPTVHLRTINPHIDLNYCDRPAHISGDVLERKLLSAYTGITARSFTGTNCHMLVYGQVDEEQCPPMPPPPVERESIIYWPEGGGRLEDESKPRRGYSIAGSWSKFECEEMQAEGDGVYGFDVVLGENRWEHFQIWLDGNQQRALHPGDMKGNKQSKVCGPEDTLLFNTWMLDGRPVSMYKTTSGFDAEQIVIDTQDTGSIGDKYRIRLRVSGKFRTVDWEKLDEKAALAEVPKGTYHVIGSWSDLAFQEMKCEDAAAGIYSLEVALAEFGGDFLVVRNKDWMQVFHPAYPGSEEAAGPSPMQHHSGTWSLGGSAGDRYKITFQRKLDGGDGTQQASWTKIGSASADELKQLERPAFYISGSWDDWMNAQKMNWTGTHYELFVELGPSETASFRFMKDRDPGQTFYPSEGDVSMSDKHFIQGPGRPRAQDLHWTIGKADWNGRKDNASEGKRFVIQLTVEDRKPSKVEWANMKPGTCMEDVICRGLIAYGS